MTYLIALKQFRIFTWFSDQTSSFYTRQCRHLKNPLHYTCISQSILGSFASTVVPAYPCITFCSWNKRRRFRNKPFCMYYFLISLFIFHTKISPVFIWGYYWHVDQLPQIITYITAEYGIDFRSFFFRGLGSILLTRFLFTLYILKKNGNNHRRCNRVPWHSKIYIFFFQNSHHE